MIQLYSIVSGSSGNCYIITDGKNSVLSDCGTSGKALFAALNDLCISPESIKGILVSHEHTDHTKGVGVVARKLKIPIYATNGTHSHMSIGKIDESNLISIVNDIQFEIGGIGITSFDIPHDAAEPCGFLFTDGNTKISIATDLGYIPESLFEKIKGSKSIILESNHDIDMLRFGDYPYPLKQRILSDVGHLSNVVAAQTALKLVQTGTEHLMLGHLSNKNNLPEIAQMETFNLLNNNDIKVGIDVTLQIANRYTITKFNL